MPLFLVIGLRGESALQFPSCFVFSFFQDIFLNHSVCRFFFADREIAPFYAAFMMARVG